MKITFIFSIPTSYRIPLFKILFKKYILKLYFTRVNVSKSLENFQGSKVLSSVSIPFMKRFSEEVYGVPEIPVTLFYHLLHDECDIIISKNLNTVSTYIAFIASWIKRKPIIIWEETWYLGPGVLRKVLSFFSAFLLKISDAIIVSGSKSKEYILSHNINEKKIFIAPNASLTYNQLNEYEKQIITHKMGLEKKKIILYLGRLIKRKGVDYLISAFKLVQKDINNCVLLVAGSGNQKNKLEHLCRRLDLTNVHFLGYVTENFKEILFSIADVFVLPSIKTDGLAEFWGLTVNEAMSSGTPVICTKAVGAAYDLIIDGFNGYVVKERDADDLAQAIIKTMRDITVATEMGSRSKEIINARFTYDNMAKGFYNAIDYVISLKR